MILLKTWIIRSKSANATLPQILETTTESQRQESEDVLSLLKVDSSMMGNYSCVAENLLGESAQSNTAEILVKCKFCNLQRNMQSGPTRFVPDIKKHFLLSVGGKII